MKLILGAKYRKTELGKKFPAVKDLPDEVYLDSIYRCKHHDPFTVRFRELIKKDSFDLFKEIFVICFEQQQLPEKRPLEFILMNGKFYYISCAWNHVYLAEHKPHEIETYDNELTHY